MLCPRRRVNHAKVAICAATLVVPEPFCEPASGFSRHFNDVAKDPALQEKFVCRTGQTGTGVFVVGPMKGTP